MRLFLNRRNSLQISYHREVKMSPETGKQIMGKKKKKKVLLDPQAMCQPRPRTDAVQIHGTVGFCHEASPVRDQGTWGAPSCPGLPPLGPVQDARFLSPNGWTSCLPGKHYNSSSARALHRAPCLTYRLCLIPPILFHSPCLRQHTHKAKQLLKVPD